MAFRDRGNLGLDILNAEGKQLCFLTEFKIVHLYYLLQQKMENIDQSIKDKVVKELANWCVTDQYEFYQNIKESHQAMQFVEDFINNKEKKNYCIKTVPVQKGEDISYIVEETVSIKKD